ncbi:MAG: hypothetical protein JSU06_02955 [Actinobacteria bacterium]|nr:hypothetical protein [Actinomycetota bacterium]
MGSEESTKKNWFRRSTIRSLKRDAESRTSEPIVRGEERDNEQTRLPEDEEVHLGGIVFSEAFTPSTVTRLYRVIESWPTSGVGQKDQWLALLAESRAGVRGGWQSLGVVLPPGKMTLGDGFNDSDLPDGVDAVWLHMAYVMPSVAMLVATFSLTEIAGDLSEVLRRDYESRRFDASLRIEGRFGQLRARVPWSRPSRYAMSTSVKRARDEKRDACQEIIRGHEEACGAWFYSRFEGRFAAGTPEERPVIRLILTKDQAPYGDERRPWFGPAGLDAFPPLWRSNGAGGWWLTEDDPPFRRRAQTMTLAGRRAEVAERPGTGPETGESNWYVMQGIGSDYAGLAAGHALKALLSLYADRLARLRDRAAIRRFPRRPVREGRELDHYLISDGLDVSTVTSDVGIFIEDPMIFGFDIPGFTESFEVFPAGKRSRPPMDYLEWLREGIGRQAARLGGDNATTSENIRASAELRQAIANTRLQRFILLLSAAAAIIAVIGILIASNDADHDAGWNGEAGHHLSAGRHP